MKEFNDLDITEKELEKQENLEEKNEEKEERKPWLYIFLFTIMLFIATFGITYTYYKGEGNDPDIDVDTGKIIFTYSDVNQAGNGISIREALPTPDTKGKMMMGANQYFDFFVTATTSSSNLRYQLLVNKASGSTLSDSKVRIYLTQLIGNTEKELVIKNVSNLPIVKYNNYDYYLLYEKDLESNLVSYSDSFRLRMWVDQNATDFENQYYSMNVDVIARQIER